MYSVYAMWVFFAKTSSIIANFADSFAKNPKILDNKEGFFYNKELVQFNGSLLFDQKKIISFLA